MIVEEILSLELFSCPSSSTAYGILAKLSKSITNSRSSSTTTSAIILIITILVVVQEPAVVSSLIHDISPERKKLR